MKKLIFITILSFVFGCKTKSSVEAQPASGKSMTPPLCFNTENPFAVDWMDRAIDYHNPTQILKFKDGDRWKYLFQSLPDGFLYDCQGNLICVTKNDHDACHNGQIATLGRGKIIWEGEGIWD